MAAGVPGDKVTIVDKGATARGGVAVSGLPFKCSAYSLRHDLERLSERRRLAACQPQNENSCGGEVELTAFGIARPVTGRRVLASPET